MIADTKSHQFMRRLCEHPRLTLKSGENAKLKPKYYGPYQIAKVLGNNRYVVRDIPGFNHTQRPFDSILSSDRINSWIKIGD